MHQVSILYGVFATDNFLGTHFEKKYVNKDFIKTAVGLNAEVFMDDAFSSSSPCSSSVSPDLVV